MCYCLWLGSGICPPRTIPLGPNICHNNFGTYRKIDSLKRLSELNVGFDYDGNTLFFTNPKFIIDALDKMHAVLNELCDKLGYKTVIVGKKNPC